MKRKKTRQIDHHLDVVGLDSIFLFYFWLEPGLVIYVSIIYI